ncbi:MAG: hypothetical protein EOP84_30750 [Verrucomicrobiaceae bacterium]|nr:MAG: hypothetical protein EOP84_30750 [Verrucomicrobiaceae bacterium]
MNRTTTYIAIVQAVVIVLGFLALGIVLKFCGYPDELGVRWNPLAVFLREYGVWLLLVPLFWTVFSLRAREVNRGIFSEPYAIISGIALAVGTSLFFLYAAIFPYTRPVFVGIIR